jgi:pimeloyl-ACP methyl ester carboxylesterase
MIQVAMLRNSFQGLSASGFHRISYTEWGEPRSAHIVICVHGLTRNARDFDTLAQALEPNCRVICPDVVGRGQSDWLERKLDYGYPQYLADMAALIARVTAASVPGTIIDWVGTSMGGLIGMLLAAAPQNPIRRLLLNDVGPLIPKAALERIALYVGKAPRFTTLAEAESYIRAVSAPFGSLTDDQWRHLAVHSVRQATDGRLAMIYDPDIAMAFQNNPMEDVSLWDSWDRITCPVLVVRGAQSDLLLASTAQEMTQRGPKARLVEFPDIGHAPALMAADQIEAIRAFLLAP